MASRSRRAERSTDSSNGLRVRQEVVKTLTGEMSLLSNPSDGHSLGLRLTRQVTQATVRFGPEDVGAFTLLDGAADALDRVAVAQAAALSSSVSNIERVVLLRSL